MKASIKWLKEFVDFQLSPVELSHMLTMTGLEVEEIEEIGDDTIIEIGITPNRPDCLSIKGIAREISTNLGIPLKETPVALIEEGDGPVIGVEAPSLCPRYVSRVIYGVKSGISPEWIIKRLESHGIRSTNNIVDITNYVLIESGHPLHAFDFDKLSEKRIVVKPAGEVTDFETLDNKKRSLNSDMLLICDADKPVAIAGVMGGINSEVGPSTTNILLECAYFDPGSIRRTSKGLGLSTESSYRFERGTDISNLADALDRAAWMITKIAGGKITRATDIYPEHYTPGNIKVNPEKIKSLIGVDIEESISEKILSGLGFKISREGGNFFVTPPGFRQDIHREVDLIEEIARIYGYDNIPATLPNIKMQPASYCSEYKMNGRVKDLMIRSGFSEAINLSFLNEAVLDQLNIPSDDRRRDMVFIKNPLKKEESALRTTLVPALLENANLNINRGEKDMSLFEISRVFFDSGQKLPEEVLQMAALYYGKADRTIYQKRHDNFYDMKGALEVLLEGLRVEEYTFISEEPNTEPYLHPGKSCSININGSRIGSIGSIHPEIAQALDLPENIVLLEIHDLAQLYKSTSCAIRFKTMPKHPYIERDIAIVVSKDISTAQAEEVILSINSDIVESVRLFDIYTGKPIAADRKSLAFSIRYRAADRTLTDSEVDQVHSKILPELERLLKAELRG
jgi:phenylalanyl-tRNA synthetase beta chain